MASTVTTFAVFQALLTRSVDQDAYLDSATKAAVKTRITNMPREQRIVLDQSKASSVQGNCSENTTTRSIDVALGAPASTNKVEYDAISLYIPVTVDGTKGVRGFAPGHAGTSALPLVEQADITLSYRTAAGDPWATFDRNTLLSEVTWIQFAATIADQADDSSVPAIHIYAEQV